MHKLFINKGGEPLDYRAFISPKLTKTDSFRTLKWKTRSRLVALFEKEQWFFGNEIVELAGLEDFDPVLQ